MQRWKYCSLRQTEQGLVYTIYRANRYCLRVISIADAVNYPTAKEPL